MSEPPLVSCLCVTEGRPALFARAYASYRSQTYPRLELLVAAMADDHATRSFVLNLAEADPTVRLLTVERQSGVTLGRRRNMLIDACAGEYLCVWDDDDVYHADRIQVSLEALDLSCKNAVALDRVLIFDAVSGRAYLSTRRIWEQTLLCRKSTLVENGIQYADLNRGEDTPLVLQLQNEIFPLTEPCLYIYCYHGHNTCTGSHFSEHFQAGTPLPAAHGRIVGDIVEQAVVPTAAAARLDNAEFRMGLELANAKLLKPWGVTPFSIYFPPADLPTPRGPAP